MEPTTAQTAKPIKVRMKKCVKCGGVKPITEFGKNSTSGDGHKSYCRECTNALHRRRHQKDPIARLKHHIAVRVKTQFPFLEGESYVKDLEKHLGYPLWKLKAALAKDLQAREGITILTAFERGYHLDHVRALASFDCRALGDAGFRTCWAISNLKLIPADVNLSKGSRAAKDYYDAEMLENTELNTAGSNP